MKPSLFLPNCILILFLAGSAIVAPGNFAAPAWIHAEAATPEGSATPAPEITPEEQAQAASHTAASIDIAARIRENLLTDQKQLKLIAMGSAIFLYPEPTKKSTKIKLKNENIRGLNELIVLGEVTSPEGVAFYHVRSTFSNDTGYGIALS